jgi:hypothetical protein
MRLSLLHIFTQEGSNKFYLIFFEFYSIFYEMLEFKWISEVLKPMNEFGNLKRHE